MTPALLRRAAAALAALAAASAPGSLPIPRWGDKISLPLAQVRAGSKDKLALTVRLPSGARLSRSAPLRYWVRETLGTVAIDRKSRKGEAVDPKLPLMIPFLAAAGRCSIILAVDWYYCGPTDVEPCHEASRVYNVEMLAARDAKERVVAVTASAD